MRRLLHLCPTQAGICLVTWLMAAVAAAERPRLDLTGAWDFYADVGEAALENVTNQPGQILVPGAWQAQGYGPPGGSIPSSVVGSDITPAAYLRHNLTARCLYVREVEVPRGVAGAARVPVRPARLSLRRRDGEWQAHRRLRGFQQPV